MRAGLARSPAITASRSPASSLDERSMIRYGIVLVSTRSLGEKLLDRLHGVRLAPVTRAEHPKAHASFRVHDERHLQAPALPHPPPLLLPLQPHPPPHPFPR